MMFEAGTVPYSLEVFQMLDVTHQELVGIQVDDSDLAAESPKLTIRHHELGELSLEWGQEGGWFWFHDNQFDYLTPVSQACVGSAMSAVVALLCPEAPAGFTWSGVIVLVD